MGEVRGPPTPFTVGEWARDAVDAWWATPRELPDGTRNPAREPAHRAARAALTTVAAHLGVPVCEVGPCARCRACHRRYGPGGGPLCPRCRAGLPEAPAPSWWALLRGTGGGGSCDRRPR